jgi:5'-deoxynucleotidase
MYKFFALLNRMKYIKRWSLMRSVAEENIMEHSQQVAVIAHALAVIKNKIYNGNIDVFKTVMLAQYHESAEVITGDLPTPIKYFNKEIQSAYKDLESLAEDKLINMLPEELKSEFSIYIKADTQCYEYKLVKAADKLSAYIKCLEELKAGNSEFKMAKQTIEKDIKIINLVEVDYFFKNFIPGFNLSLDELE